MKLTSRITLAIVALLTAAVQAFGAQTNVVQNINFKITVYTQGDTTTNSTTIVTPAVKLSKSTKDIIQVLGEALTNGFSTTAKLLLVSPIDGSDPSIVVQDGTNITDVSGFFSFDQISSDSVRSSLITIATGAEKSTEYSIIRLSMQDDGPLKLNAHFDVSGLATIKSASIVQSGVIIGDVHQINETLAGEGDFTDGSGTHYFIVQMKVTVAGNTLMVTP